MKEELLQKIKEFDERRKVFTYLCECEYPLELIDAFQKVRHYLLERNRETNEEIGKLAMETLKQGEE